ncbi:Nitric oxide dioxygenase [Dermatophilus congolensis]|uniref:nitric oxide dioxygenase n=1 Tax=Dermatophilus congolensis TaxID=1863 RepID=A0AA46BPT6_9MICO|nr:globin domain-containing protein [Dermatophilus congolensis]STD14129.1 Nitric oxide dioxygenase [Dermatophilus congolensis]
MLSAPSATIVKATAALVAEHSTLITTQFYSDMFHDHPELTNIFNMANQAIGEQPKALAASVVAYATHLISPETPDFTPVLRRIAHKHVSLGVTAPQYTIVGHYLMQAIGKTLGDTLTPDIAAAWNEVYWLFATQLIAEEAKLYALAGTNPNTPWHDYTVTDRIHETDTTFSLHLRPTTGTLPAWQPGQYITLNIEIAPGHTQPRQYTISGQPDENTFRITIKKIDSHNESPAGAVSTWLAANAHPGTHLQVSQPCGDITLDNTNTPLALISAGVGITPMAAILEDLAQRQPERDIYLLHADHCPALHPLRTTIATSTATMPNITRHCWYETPDNTDTHTGHMDLSTIDLPTNTHVFMCGPLPFMRNIHTQLTAKGIPTTNISYEVFGPDMWTQNPNNAA